MQLCGVSSGYRRMAAEIKKEFVDSLSSEARESYVKTVADPQKAGDWIRLYNYGLQGVEVTRRADYALSAKEAKEAYDNGKKFSAEPEDIITLLEENRIRQTSLKDGQRITLGGGESAVRYSLPFYSMKEKDVNRIGWAEELFSDEDKMLLNDRFVDIMIHKDLGDAIRLKGGSYLLDVNNKIVIIGGSFNNPAIHFVMVINTDNATYAQEIKEVIFTHEHLKSLTAREASSGISIYETYFGQEVVRGYNSQDFGYNAQSANIYARLPEGFSSYGYTRKQQDGSGVFGEAEGDGELRYFLDTAEVSEEKVAEKKRRLLSADAYDLISDLVNAGKTLAEIRSDMKDSDVSSKEVRKMVEEIKKGFVSSLSPKARESYVKTVADPQKAGDWIKLYNYGLNDVEVTRWADYALPTKEAKAAYEFGKEAQSTAIDATELAEPADDTKPTPAMERVATDAAADQQRQQGAVVSSSAATGTEEQQLRQQAYDQYNDGSTQYPTAFNTIYAAGKQLGDFDTAYESVKDLLSREAAFDIFNAGGLDRGAAGTTEVKVTKGEGEYTDSGENFDSAYRDLYKAVAKLWGVDISTVSVKGANGKFLPSLVKILVSDETKNELQTLGHELVEFARAFGNSGKFVALRNAVIDFYVEKHGRAELDRQIQKYLEAYRAKDPKFNYNHAEKEFVCDFIGGILANEAGLREFVDQIEQRADLTEDEKRGILQSLLDLLRKALEKIEEFLSAGDPNSSVQLAAEAEADTARNMIRLLTDALDAASDTVSRIADGDTVTITGNEGATRNQLDENLGQQINDWIKHHGKAGGTYNGRYFELGTTPDIFIKHGAPKVDLIMYEECLLKVNGEKHQIQLSEIARLPSQLNDPILLFRGSHPNSFVALTELKNEIGHDVVVVVHINKRNNRSVINKIASVYSKTDNDTDRNKIRGYVRHQIESGNLLDASIKKAPLWFTSRGLQLPKLVQTIIDANTKITQKDPSVKNNSMQAAENNADAERKSIDIDSFANDDKTIKELKLLEEHVDQLLEISGGDRKSVPKTRAFAAQLLKEYESSYSYADLSDDLIKLYAYVGEHTGSSTVPQKTLQDITERANAIAKRIVDNEITKKKLTDEAALCLDEFRRTKLYFNDTMKGWAIETVGSWAAFKKELKGTVHITTKVSPDAVSTRPFSDYLENILKSFGGSGKISHWKEG